MWDALKLQCCICAKPSMQSLVINYLLVHMHTLSYCMINPWTVTIVNIDDIAHWCQFHYFSVSEISISMIWTCVKSFVNITIRIYYCNVYTMSATALTNSRLIIMLCEIYDKFNKPHHQSWIIFVHGWVSRWEWNMLLPLMVDANKQIPINLYVH